MNLLTMKKNLAMFAAAMLLSVPLLAGAQDNNQQVYTDDTQFDVTLKSTEFDSDSRALKMNLSIQNNTSYFFDDLQYNFEIYAGDTLAEEGELFGELELIDLETNSLLDVDPYSAFEQMVSYKVPADFDPGNYFVRLVVYSAGKANFFDIVYTPEAIALDGTGGYLGLMDGDVILKRSVDDKTEFNLLEGPPLLPDDNFSVQILNSKNPNLAARLAGVENVYFNYLIKSAGEDDADNPDVGEYQQKEATVLATGLELDFGTGVDLIPGPNYVHFYITDESGASLGEPLMAIWLVEGFYARISDLLVDTNYYQKGDIFSIDAEILSYDSYQGTDDAADISGFYVIGQLTTDQGEVIEFRQDLNPLSSDGVDMLSDFGYKFTEDTVVTDVKLSLYDSTGNLVNSVEREIDTSKLVIDGQVVTESSSYMMYYVVAAIIILLILIIILIYRSRTKIDQNPITMSALIIALGSVIAYGVLFSADVANGAYCNQGGPCSPTTINLSLTGSQGDLGQCPKSIQASISAHISCKHCTNGVWTTLRIFANGQQVIAKGKSHDNDHLNNYYVGPFTTTLSVTESTPSLTYYGTATVFPGYNCGAATKTTSSKTITCSTDDGGDGNPGGNPGGDPGDNDPDDGDPVGGGDGEFSATCYAEQSESVPANGSDFASWFALVQNEEGSVSYVWEQGGTVVSTDSNFSMTATVPGDIDDLIVSVTDGVNTIDDIQCPIISFEADLGVEFFTDKPVAVDFCPFTWSVGPDVTSCEISTEGGSVEDLDISNGSGVYEADPGNNYKLSCSGMTLNGDEPPVLEEANYESEFIGCLRDLNYVEQ